MPQLSLPTAPAQWLSQGAVAWGLSLVLFPYLALPAFQAARLNRQQLTREIEQAAPGRKPLSPELAQAQVGYENLALFPLTTGNQVDLLIDAEDTFAAIFAAIRQAKAYILAEFSSLRPTAPALSSSRFCWTVPKSFFQDMRDAAVEVVAFAPGGWMKGRLQINFRNHRKTVVVDGEVAFVGGMNVSDDSLGCNPLVRPPGRAHRI